MEFSRLFLEANLLRVIVDLFDNETLVEFLYHNHSTILVKCVSVFYFLCKEALYCKKSNDDLYENETSCVIRILINHRDRIELLSNNLEENTKLSKFKSYFIYVLYLVSLAYLQYKFKNECLLCFKHYEHIACRGFMSTSFISFREVTNAFVDNEKIERDFMNEMGEREKQRVTRIVFIQNSKSAMAYTIVDVLNNINVCFQANETKSMAYKEYEYFFKSIIFYGLTIEKIICLNCLVSFSNDLKVREAILRDDDLIFYLKSLILMENEQDFNLKTRLRNLVRKLLEQLKL
jgi:hypothetical protein